MLSSAYLLISKKSIKNVKKWALASSSILSSWPTSDLVYFSVILPSATNAVQKKPARKTELIVKSIKKRGQTWPNEVKFVDRKVFLSTNLTAFFDSQPEIAADSRG